MARHGVALTRASGLALAGVLCGILAQGANAATIAVTSAANSGPGSLRAAITAANPNDTITIPAIMISLTTGELAVSKSLTISGAGARATTIDGGGVARIFDVSGAVNVTLSGMTITGGVSSVGGGGVAVGESSAVTLSDSAVVGNTAFGATSGGGIANNGGTLTITRSLIANNFAGGAGGGIATEVVGSNGGFMTMTDSTVTGNLSASRGGGVYENTSTHPIALTNDTLEGNSAVGGGGAFDIENQSPVSLTNTIISANHGESGAQSCQFAGGSPASFSGGHNIEDTTPTQCMMSSALGDEVGVNPQLGELQDNGGPTDTEAIMSTSSALDAGSNAVCPSVDQRGVTRPQGAACDVGAYELVPTVDLGVRALAAPTSARVGDVLTLPFLVTSFGPQTAAGVTLALALPSGLGLVSVAGATGCMPAPTDCALGALSLASSTLVDVTVKATAAGVQTLTATVSGALVDLNPANNSGGAVVTVTPGPAPVAPVLGPVTLSPTRFRRGSRLPTLARAATGTTISFSLRQAAKVRLAFARRVAGVVSGHRCVASRSQHSHAKGCTRMLSAGALTIAARPGVNKLRFAGRLTRTSTLVPGSYLLTATARSAAGASSRSRTASFTLLP